MASAGAAAGKKRTGGLDFNQFSVAQTQVESGAHAVKFVTSHKAQRRKRYFSRELRKMMYGFGDVSAPVEASVEVLEDLVCEFILTVVANAMANSKRKGSFKIEDLLFVLRSDRKKYLRIKDLVKRSEEVRDIRKTFEVDKEDLAALESKSVAKGSAAKADKDKGDANEDEPNDDDAGDASP